MKHRRFASTTVSAIGAGTAAWSLTRSLDDVEAEILLKTALDAGITYVDTAAAYTTASESSHNEALIARVLGAHHDGVIVATKGGHTRNGNQFPVDGRPEAIRADCERSLLALGAEAIDLYYLHKPDPLVPFADSIGALESLRIEGKVRATGISNVSPNQLNTALAITPVSAVQNTFSPFNTSDISTAKYAHELGITYFIYSPLGGPDRKLPLAEALPLSNANAVGMGISIEQAVLAWQLTVTDSVVPVVGFNRSSTLLSSVEAASIHLGETFLLQLSEEIAGLNVQTADAAVL
jgi:aryl-alcohol dehydrogenase-like predicted oxidoreductase